MGTIPHSLDWVAKRASCNVGNVFDEICTDVEKDVAAINAAKKLPEDNQFSMNQLSVGNTIIIGQLGAVMSPRIVVKIGIIGDEIEVQDGAQKKTWRVRVGLNDEGRCLLRFQDSDTFTELEQWQFRKRALEGLFFGA